MTLAGVAFFFALSGLIGLFALKRWEHAHDRTLFSDTRRSADDLALRVKEALIFGFRNISKLPYILWLLGRYGVHSAAVMFGHLAHAIGERSHALADMVSYKHRFERRETHSEFLKKVIEHPIRNTNGSGSSPQYENSVVPVQKDTEVDRDPGFSAPAAPTLQGALQYEERATLEAAPSPKKKKSRRITRKKEKIEDDAHLTGEGV